MEGGGESEELEAEGEHGEGADCWPACRPAGRPTDRPTYLLNFIEIFLCSMRFFKEKVMHVTLAI